MDISSLSDYDYVTLVASYNDLVNGSSSRVASETVGRGYTPEQLAQATGRLVERYKPVESCNLRFTKPFTEMKYDLLGYVLILNENYERGHLPFCGSVSDQPAQVMEIFSILRQLKFEIESKNAASSQRTMR